MTDSPRYPFLDAYGIFPSHSSSSRTRRRSWSMACPAAVSTLPIRWSVTSWDAWSPGVAAAI